MKDEIFEYIKNKNKNLSFNEKKHQYKIEGKEDLKLISVTQFIGRVKEPFNAYEVAKKLSDFPNCQYYKMDPKDIIKLWSLNANRGTKKHAEVEKYLNGELDNFIDKPFFDSINFSKNNCLSELKLYSEKFALAGTADIVEIKENDKNIDVLIHDIKTFQSLTDDRLESFNLQTIIYTIMLRELLSDFKKEYSDYNLKVNPGKLLWYEPYQNISESNYDSDIDTQFNFPRLIDVQKNFNVYEKVKKLLTDRKNELKNYE